MHVDVSLCTILKHLEQTTPANQGHGRGAGGEGQMELAEGATLAHVAAELELPEDLGWVGCVNGRPARPESPLTEGDRVYLFLPVSGG